MNASETDAIAFFLEDGQGVLDAIDGHSVIFGRHETSEIGERIAAIGDEIIEGKTRLDEQSHLGARHSLEYLVRDLIAELIWLQGESQRRWLNVQISRGPGRGVAWQRQP